MAILSRFQDIISANINAVIDRMEDPEKMIDQYLRDMMEDLAEVKQNTAGVMAEETKSKRLVDENEAEVMKYTNFAKKAIEAGNDDDARVFLAKKQELEDIGTGLANSYAKAHENATKMRQMHDKLASDIEKLRGRRSMIKAQLSVADTQEKLNEVSESIGKTDGAMSAFQRMEEKATRKLDEANAMADLNAQPEDPAKSLEEKYSSQGSAAVEDELSRLKEELGK
ncbi:MAG: PspA/IM30 family protein [Desemzia incerta]|uniref:Phage shock protein A (PspA) family protein n=1 Tax=Desemzia incerta TaxID=82801 RepID=A0A1I5V9G9_9LACT|nr:MULTISPECIES: PspA/IM30 family protein [Desemzia]MCI3027765.1 PspA/IM30 family protein [Desemzia sp. C1]WHZ32006.1 PspA/IM30 family protein [Desemzia incerta]SFQ03586.1 phage shock protein A (PspA) family protein [Desemzia incerta]